MVLASVSGGRNVVVRALAKQQTWSEVDLVSLFLATMLKVPVVGRSSHMVCCYLQMQRSMFKSNFTMFRYFGCC